MNLKDLVLKLKAAVEAGKWFDAARLVADLIRASADLGELVFGVSEDVSAELAELEKAVAESKANPAAANAAGVDPNTVIQLILLALELFKQWKKR